MKQKKLLLIAGLPRSGGSLMNRLFDGHPKIASYPFEARFGHGHTFLKKYNNVTNVKSLLEKSGRLNVFRRVVAGQKGKGKHLPFDKVKFEENLMKSVKSNIYLEEAIGMISNAFFSSLKVEHDSSKFFDYSNKELVTWHASNSHFGAGDFLDYTKNGCVIHLIRSPFDTISSFLKYKKSYKIDPVIESLLWRESTLRALLFKLKWPKRFFILRYEDLVSNTEKIMNILSEFLSIDFHENFLTPSSGNKIWQGNSSYAHNLSLSNSKKPISTKPIGKSFESLSQENVELIKNVCGNDLNRWGYIGKKPYFNSDFVYQSLFDEVNEKIVTNDLLCITNKLFGIYIQSRQLNSSWWMSLKGFVKNTLIYKD